MQLIEHTSAIQELSPYLRLIRDSMTGGWEMFTGLPSKYRIAMSPSARAHVVHDFTIDCASKILTAARIFDKATLKLFVFDSICLRFKKFDGLLTSRNQPTSQVKAFRGQQQLDGVTGVHNLEAGYTLDEFEQSISSLHIVCPNGRTNYWEMELLEEGISTPVVDMFSDTSEDVDPGSKPVRYRRKKSGVIIPFESNDHGA